MKNWRDKFPFDLGLIISTISSVSLIVFVSIFVLLLVDKSKDDEFRFSLIISALIYLLSSQLQIWVILRRIYRDLLPEKNLSGGSYKFLFNFGLIAILPLALICYLMLDSYIERKTYIEKTETAMSVYSKELEKLELYLNKCKLYKKELSKLGENLEKHASAKETIWILWTTREQAGRSKYIQDFNYCNTYPPAFQCDKEECDYFPKVFSNNSKEILYRKVDKGHWVYIPIKGQTKTMILLFKFPIEEKK
jgi:hypothetical protein